MSENSLFLDRKKSPRISNFWLCVLIQTVDGKISADLFVVKEGLFSVRIHYAVETEILKVQRHPVTNENQ